MGIFQRAVQSVLLTAIASSLPFIGSIAHAQTITQGYDIETNVNLQRGMIVALKEDDPKKVEAINNSVPKRMHGVVVGSGDSSFILTKKTQKIYITNNSKFDVLISDQNGIISPKDFISLSTVSGIGK